jgi:hypothetical protein
MLLWVSYYWCMILGFQLRTFSIRADADTACMIFVSFLMQGHAGYACKNSLDMPGNTPEILRTGLWWIITMQLPYTCSLILESI